MSSDAPRALEPAVVVEQAGELDFRVPVEGGFCSGAGALYGGWAMGLAAEAAQRAMGQPLRRISTNFLQPVRRDAELSLRVTPYSRGPRLAQCQVDGLVDGAVAYTSLIVTAADANRSEEGGGVTSWAHPPKVPPAQSCPPRAYRSSSDRFLADTMDVRVVDPVGEPYGGDGRGRLWARLRVQISGAAALVVLSDHVPYLVHRALPRTRAARTVGASLVLSGAVPDSWVLLDLELVSWDGRYCAGRVSLHSPDGRVLGAGEQLVRTVTAGCES